MTRVKAGFGSLGKISHTPQCECPVSEALRHSSNLGPLALSGRVEWYPELVRKQGIWMPCGSVYKIPGGVNSPLSFMGATTHVVSSCLH